MNRLIVDEQNQLMEERKRSFPEQPFAVKTLAKIISVIFHPVFVPVYVILFLVYIHPYLFAGFPGSLKLRTVMMGFVAFTFFPLVTVLLLKALNFIDTIYLKTQRDRIIPIIACMVWYFWVGYVWNNFGKTDDAIDMPRPIVQFAYATFGSTIITLMVNTRIKISLHAISMGIMIAFMFLLAFTQELNFGIYLSVSLFIAGLVCTARFIASDHTAAEVYGGLMVGIISMLAAFIIG
jgi:hypothetical protein